MSDLATPIALQKTAADNAAAAANANEAKPKDEPEVAVDLGGDDDSDDRGNDADDGYEEHEFEGKKARIPKEWKELIPMGKDYRFKTGKLSEEQKAVQAERKQYADGVKAIQNQMRAIEPPMPDIALKDRNSDKYDPDQYDIMMHNRAQWVAKMQRVNSEQKRLEKEDSDKAEKEHGEILTARQRAIYEAQPKWKDEAKRAADEAEVQKYVRGQPDHIRLADDEIKDLSKDPRLSYYLHKAMLYDRAVEKAKAAASGTPNNPEPVARPVAKVRGGTNSGNFNPYSKSNTTENYVAWRERQRRKAQS